MAKKITVCDKNLLVFLRNCTSLNCRNWSFREANFSEIVKTLLWPGASCGKIICYKRSHTFIYLLTISLLSLSFWRRIPRIYFVSDGFLSCYFSSDQADCYRYFSHRHLPPLKSTIARLMKKIPLFLRSQHRYLIFFPKKVLLPGLRPIADFMFLSNPEGKLLLLSSETLRSGQGTIYKTTASPEYLNVIEQEFLLMKELSGKPEIKSLLPRALDRSIMNNSELFGEQYLYGKTLRDMLRSSEVCKSSQKYVCYFEQLNCWYRTYRKGFAGAKRGYTELIAWIFPVYCSAYGSDAVSEGIIADLQYCLADCDSRYPGLVPVISHNDLWPGNFIVSSHRLVAVDWERAVADRAELFDYFWMMVSAGIEVLVGRDDLSDYTAAFEIFLGRDDHIYEIINGFLNNYLSELGIDSDDYELFFFLFLLELSIQGFLVLGRLTDMDRLVHVQVRNYSEAFLARYKENM